MAAPPLCWRHSSMEDKMSQANSCIHSGLQGGGQAASLAGTPHCTALLFLHGRSCIPQAEKWVHPPYRSSLGVPCQWPWQIACSISFHPDSVACRNILWRMNRWWGPPAFHHGYSLRNRSTSRWHSASLMDSPLLFASPLGASNLCLLSVYCSSNKAW